MSIHQTECEVQDETPVLNSVEIAFQHLRETHKDIPDFGRGPQTKRGKYLLDAPISIKQQTGMAICVLRDWLDELDKIQRETESGSGRQSPESKRLMDVDNDNVDESSRCVSSLENKDTTKKRTRSGSLTISKDEKSSFCIDSGFELFRFLYGSWS
jgi:hypothetical protein